MKTIRNCIKTKFLDSSLGELDGFVDCDPRDCAIAAVDSHAHCAVEGRCLQFGLCCTTGSVLSHLILADVAVAMKAHPSGECTGHWDPVLRSATLGSAHTTTHF